MPRPKGTGSVIVRDDSAYLWIKYSHDGKLFRESTHTNNHRKAERILKARLAALATGTFVPPSTERIRMEELALDLLREYRMNARKSLPDAIARWNLHLKPFFGSVRAVNISSDLVSRYKEQRQEEGAANATINRELALLKRALRLAQQATPPKVSRIPRITKLAENNVRKEFLEERQFQRLLSYCKESWFVGLLLMGRTYGWRISELLLMRVSQVDLAHGTIRLEPGTTKNRDGREVTMTSAIHNILVECMRGKDHDDFVFTRPNGKPVRDFRTTWWYACVAAGVGRLSCRRCTETTINNGRCAKCKGNDLKYKGLIFHDLRRTAARDLRAAGVAEGVIMKIGGWRTRSVFERYAIVSNNDVADAMSKLEAHQNGHVFGHVPADQAPLPRAQASSTLNPSSLSTT